MISFCIITLVTMEDTRKLEAVIGNEHSGERLDVALARIFPDYSRSYLQNSIKQGLIFIDGRVLRARELVSGGEKVVFTPRVDRDVKVSPEKIDFEIVDEDNDLLIINKAAGIVVHPAPGHHSGTLVNALLDYYPPSIELPRAGIVHRLDKDTSGVMVVAKSHKAYNHLIQAIRLRQVKREYIAIVRKAVTTGGKIDAPISRHPTDRKRMAVIEGGRDALTYYRVSRRFKFHTLVELSLITGRTHQIRVHLAHIGHPVVGDQVYGGRFQLLSGWSEENLEYLKNFKRQALNAQKLSLIHPVSNKECEWKVAIPADMEGVLSRISEEERR